MSDLTDLAGELLDAFDYLPQDLQLEIIDKFDAIACSTNSLNCVSIEDNEDFIDMTDSRQVPLLGDYD